MPPKKFTRTQLRVTDIHESDDTLQAAASTAKRTTPTVLPEAEIDDDNDLQDDLEGQRSKDSLIDNVSGVLRSQITDEDRPDVATQNRLMLEMPLENQAPSGKPNRDSDRRGWQPNRNEWQPQRINGLPNAPNAPNEAPWAQD